MDNSIKLLKIKDSIFIGSYSDTKIKYPLDVDLQEIAIEKYNPNQLLNIFQNKYKIAIKNDTMFIIDFKCGKYKGQPIRWNKYTIKAGYQHIDDVKINFIDTIRQNEIIKLDLITLINKQFVEFSINYYFEPLPNKEDIENIFLREFQFKMSHGEYFKALKRLYSYAKITKNKVLINNLINFLNGPTGALNYQINSLNIILSVLSNSFRTPTKGSILYNLTIIRDNLPTKYLVPLNKILSIGNIQDMVYPIEQLIEELNKSVNDTVQLFIKGQIDFQEVF